MEKEEGPPPLNAKEQQSRFKLFKFAPNFAAVLFVAVTGGLVLSGTVRMNVREQHAKTFADKLQFTLQYQTFSVLWIFVLILNGIREKAKNGFISPSDDCELNQANNLQNTFQQFLIFSITQFILVAFINEQWAMRTIPLVNFMFLIGRVTSFLGYKYSYYRNFGMFLSLLPTIAMMGVAVIKFLGHLWF